MKIYPQSSVHVKQIKLVTSSANTNTMPHVI